MNTFCLSWLGKNGTGWPKWNSFPSQNTEETETLKIQIQQCSGKLYYNPRGWEWEGRKLWREAVVQTRVISDFWPLRVDSLAWNSGLIHRSLVRSHVLCSRASCIAGTLVRTMRYERKWGPWVLRCKCCLFLKGRSKSERQKVNQGRAWPKIPGVGKAYLENNE